MCKQTFFEILPYYEVSKTKTRQKTRFRNWNQIFGWPNGQIISYLWMNFEFLVITDNEIVMYLVLICNKTDHATCHGWKSVSGLKLYIHLFNFPFSNYCNLQSNSDLFNFGISKHFLAEITHIVSRYSILNSKFEFPDKFWTKWMCRNGF